MAIGNQLVFDINGNVEDFIFILSTKDFHHLGALENVKPDSVHNSGNLMSANEISFEVYKTLEKDSEETSVLVEETLWDDIDDLKLIYIRELDEYFEMSVQLDDTTESVKKTVTCTSLCESELGQLNIHGLEVNTELDIARPDYMPTIFYNIENIKASLLDRIVLSFAPNYTIKHVDESLWKIQRTFSVDGTNVYDWFMGECSKEFNCIFMFNSTERGIYVYDLSTVCKDCGYRGEYIDTCPECGSLNLSYFGDDTTIYIDKENLTDAIQLTTDKDSIKNCFKLVAGDDVMTAMVRLINPNGSSFIYKPTDKQLAEMPIKLQDKLSKYNELYLSKQNEHERILADIFKSSEEINKLTHTMMPPVEHEKVTAQTEAEKLNSININLLGMSKISSSTNPSKSTVESALVSYARVFVNTGTVKISINNSSYQYIGIDSDGWNYGTWTGNFKVESYTDKNDIAYSPIISVKITNDYGTFIEQKIMKNISNDSNDENSVFDVLSIEDLNDFRDALKLYCLKRLESFYDAIQTALTALLELDQASKEADYYDSIYLTYYNKLQACQEEINIRQSEIDIWQNIYDNLILQQEELQAELNFEDYLGEEFYKIYNLYRREDIYQNNHYISEGLNTSEQLKKAKEFFEVANQELEKARTPKYSISSTLYNLLIIPEFKPLIHNFKLGNWLRICVDDEIYRLRLVGYRLSFSSIQTLEVTFSNVTKVNSPISQRDELFDLVKSMASTYDYYASQAKKGNESYVEINRWFENSLNSSLMAIKNNNNEEIVTDKHGIIARTYNDITGNYEPEQLRITHNILAFTENFWETSSLAIGKHNYVYFDKTTQSFKEGIGYGVSSKFLQAPFIHGGQMIASELLSENYSPITGKGAYLNLNDGAFSLADSRLVYDPVTNKLTVKGLTIDWNSTTSPSVDDVDGLNDELDNIGTSLKDLDKKFADELTDYVTNTVFNGSISDLQSQIDGNITTWFEDGEPALGKYPSSEWKTDKDKNTHLGDLYYDNITGYAYRFQLTGSTYEWIKITDTDVVKALANAKHAQDTADGKRRVFVSTPISPYDIGDLWAQGEDGELMKCIKARTDKETYVSTDWTKASKYTDDSALHSFIEVEYADDLKDIAKQVDGKARAWYQSEDPSLIWDTNEDHEGDLWYDTNAESQVTSIYQNGAWKATSVPKSLFDTIDGIASIYVTLPDKPQVGDLLIPSTDIGDYKAGKVYKYDVTSWIEISYTDDTKANEALDVANNAKGIAEKAEDIGNKLVSGLDFQKTEITGKYVISPVIAGGTLLIGDKDGTYAEITPEGILNCAGANIAGTINATNGNISGWKINKTQIFKTIDLYDDMTSAGLSGLADNDPVQYWVWIRSPVNSTTPVLGIYYKRKYDYLAGNDTVYRIFSAQTNGVVYANSFNSSNANITGGSLKVGSKFAVNSSGDLTSSNANITGGRLNIRTTDGFDYDVLKLESSRYIISFSSCGLQIFDTSSGRFTDLNYYGLDLGTFTGTPGNNLSMLYGRTYYDYDSARIEGTLTVTGTKSRLATTENYNDRLLYCYETPSPMFGDLGEGKIDETGKCYVFLDDIFAETIDTDCVYQVFLQPYGKGECYVTERTSSYFVVEGTENLSFGWELKAIQKDFDTIRLEEPKENETDSETTVLNETYNYLDSLLYDVESEEF